MTAAIPSVVFGGWRELKRDLIHELFPEDGRFRQGAYLFRGMADAGWHLTTSFDRRFAQHPPRQRVALFERLVENFRRACQDYGVPEQVWSDDRKLLALGQHYGLPTRLLDWSESPYIAAFFAFQDIPGAADPGVGHICVWALHRSAPAWHPDLGVEVFSAPSSENSRARNQSGYFTLSRGPFATLEEHVTHVDDSGTALRQFLVPRAEAAAALADLDIMGVNHARLFPDLSGAAQASTLRLLLDSAPDA
ncbi:MAG: FRG domain-containing protein [Actinomycetes bacterium]